jgi:hypothetical protein
MAGSRRMRVRMLWAEAEGDVLWTYTSIGLRFTQAFMRFYMLVTPYRRKAPYFEIHSHPITLLHQKLNKPPVILDLPLTSLDSVSVFGVVPREFLGVLLYLDEVLVWGGAAVPLHEEVGELGRHFEVRVDGFEVLDIGGGGGRGWRGGGGGWVVEEGFEGGLCR